MTQQLALSGPQLGLILEMLQTEQRKLFVEIRHTDTASYRDGLKKRQAMVDALILQIESVHEAEQAEPA
jgi:hypothetical protein